MKWRAEELSVMKELRSNGSTWQEVTDSLNRQFGTSRTLDSVKLCGRKHGVSGSHDPYTKAQDNWIIANVDKYDNYKAMAEDFNRIFGTDKKDRGLQSHAVRYLGIISGRQAFKKGHHTHNKKDIGDEYVNSSNGYTYVKVSDDKDRNKAWQGKHRIVYMERHGEIQDGHNVIFLDGDKTNFSHENLVSISDRTNRILQSRSWHFNNAKLTKAAIKTIELENAVKEVGNENT